MKKIIIPVLSFIISLTFCITAFAANPVSAPEEWLNDWDERTSVSGKIWILPGKEEDDRIFTWLSDSKDTSFSYSDGNETFSPEVRRSFYITFYVNTVTLSDLADGEYSYTFTADSKEYIEAFSISSEDTSFTAMFCSDPQLGRSGEDSEEAVANDTYGWERTLNSAVSNGAELILSTGDQVNDGFSKTQYNALFSPDALSSIPFVPTAGNHDFYSPLFPMYFGNAGNNSFGNDYYFSYGNALFIVLDSNNIISPIHTATIKNAIDDYPDAKWRVVLLHHGAYSSCKDEFTNKLCAGTLKGIFDKYDIDLALSGHNHFYSRTYPIYDGGISSIGTVYFEAGSASGSKCSHYDTSSDGLIVQSHDLSEASYSILTFTDDAIEVTSYLTDSGEVFDSFTVVNTEKTYISTQSFLEKVIEFFKHLLSYIPVLY